MGIMVIAVFDEWRGFGLPLTICQILLIKNSTGESVALAAGRASPRKVQEGDSPGLKFCHYGNGKRKEGYWYGI